MIPAIGRKRRFQCLGECIDPFRQIECKIIEKITVDGSAPPHPLRRDRVRDAEIIEHPPEGLTLPEGAEIMNPDGAVDAVPGITAHQTARQGVLLDDGHALMQPGKDDPGRKPPDSGTDDQRIKRFLCFHRRPPA
jgi:hypothetical protein